MKRPPKTWPPWPRSCRSAGFTATAAASCLTSGKACEIIATLVVEPQAPVGKDKDELPVATGLPRTWDEIGPGHLVIAQEALEYGWWEAIVLARTGDMLTLRFRDYPKLPKFARHRTAVALMSP